MKIRNIIAVGLSLFALASCSKDNQPVNVNDLKDATLDIKVKASAPGSSLKADGDENALEGEMNINSIAVLSFTADGSQLLVDPYWTNGMSVSGGEATVLNVPTKATIAMIAILANVPADAFKGVASYGDFQTRLAQLSDQSQSSLAMSAQVITSDDRLEEGDNYIGYSTQTNINNLSSPLELTRLAARIELKSASTNFETNDKLKGRTVRINSIYFANRKTASRYASTAYWSAVMADGNLDNSPAVTLGQNLPLSGTPFRQYVMENTDSENPTAIVINATILANAAYQAETKNFSAVVNENGVVLKGDPHKYVKRNYIYRLNISFGPNSFEGIDIDDPIPPDPPTPPTPPAPSTGDLSVSVEVVGWGPVNQEVVIK